MQTREDILGIGITGKTLTDAERRMLSSDAPGAIVLFGRNVGTAEELRALVREIKRTASRPPLVMIDEEGGRVDRLRHLLPGLPSAEALGSSAMPAALAAWSGRVIGAALRWFDIDIDLAPVVDIRGDQSPKGLELRTFGRDAATVTELAGAFVRGLHAHGTAGCLKHFPGIGLGSADPHYGATVVDAAAGDLAARDLLPFQALSNEVQAVMIGHGTYPRIDEPDLPASLSRRLAHDLLRDRLGFTGVAISDDMEMHAVSDIGSYEEIAERALIAGNDVILFCSRVERVPELQQHLAARVAVDPGVRARFEDAAARLRRYRAHCAALRAAGAEPAHSFDDVLAEGARLVEALAQAHDPATGPFTSGSEGGAGTPARGKGRTGREEWT